MTYITRVKNPSQAPARNAFSIPSASIMRSEKSPAKKTIHPNSYIHIVGRNQGRADVERLSALRRASI